MSFRTLLFPPSPRGFSGMRWCNIALRSLHLVGIAGLAASYLPQQTGIDGAMPFWELTLYSGGGMVALSLWSNGRWLVQLRGIVILFKLVMFGLLPWLDSLMANGAGWGYVTLIVLSSVIAHAPGKLRYFQITPLP